MNKVPAVRFAGFTDPWEQRKLGELADFSKGQGYSKADLRDEGTPIILYGRLYTNYETVISHVDTYAAERDFSVKSQGNEVIVPASGETAEDISVASAVVRPGVLIGGDLNVVRPHEELGQVFLALAITGASPHEQMTRRAQGKTIVHLHSEDLTNIDILYPSRAEQRAIDAFFQRLDDLITLHQRKLDSLTTLKKALLDKMFPRDGALVPEIRFAGFTDPWEQRKWNSSVSMSTDMVSPIGFEDLMHIGPGNIEPFTGRLLDGVTTVGESDLISGKYRFHKGDVIYSKIRPQLAKCTIAPDEGLASADTYVLRGVDLEQAFLFTLLRTESFYGYTTSVSMRTGMPKVNRDELNAYSFLAPSRDEQQAIGAFFQRLDDLITLHQRKLELLKNLKAACLDKMFV